MLNEVISNINKRVAITLINGKEKSGTIIGIDIENHTIKLKDDSGNNIPVLISIIGMIEPVIALNGNIDILLKDNTQQLNNASDALSAKKQATIQKITKLQILYGTEIKNAFLSIVKPDFTTPTDIKRITYSAISEENRLFSNIKNKYESSVKLGRLLPNSDELRVITNLVVTLSEKPELENSVSVYNYLGYFHHLNNSKTDTIKAYEKAAKLSNKAEEWLNLAAVAIERSENELACLALEKLFLVASCTNKLYEKAWYKFSELIIKYSAYSSLKTILSRKLLETEYERIFETACYCLLENGHNKTVEIEIEQSLSNNDFRLLALNCLTVLPEQPNFKYEEFKLNFNKIPKPIVTTPKVEKILVPKITFNSFSKPKNVDILREARTARDTTKEYVKAEKLFTEGIEKEYNQTIKQGAIRDLASMLAQQMKEPQKAINVIDKYQLNLIDADLHLLFNFNVQLEEYTKAIDIQKKLLKNTHKKDQLISRFTSLASCYFKLSSFKEAENYYRQAFKINPSLYNVERNIAHCLFKQGKVKEAKDILNRIIADYGDTNSLKILDIIEGRNQSTDFEIDTAGLVFENLDNFATFYLSTCDFKYVEKNRIEHGKYIGTEDNKKVDIDTLVRTASTLRTKIAEERSNIYLNAARIYYDLGEKDNDFYSFLCRSFTSKGDNAVKSNNSIETVKTFYLTALKVYDALYYDEGQNKRDEQDAVNALCRFMYSILGRDKIPVLVVDHKSLSLRDTLNDVLPNLTDRSKFFQSLGLVFSRSPQYSMNRVLKILFENAEFRKSSCQFLDISSSIDQKQFAEAWTKQAKEFLKKENELYNLLSPLLNFSITETWLLSSIERVKNCIDKVLFDLDKDYLVELQKLLDNSISLCKAADHDEKNNKLDDLYFRTENFVAKIKQNPTKLAIESVLSIAQNVVAALDVYRKTLFTNSKPELRFSSVFPAYQLKNTNRIDLQIKIENQAEGHAEEVELLLTANPIYLKTSSSSIAISYNTIKGLKSDSKIIELELTEKAIREKAFSLQVKATFKNRLNEGFTTQIESLPVQLGEQKDFIEIKPNPYANGASGRAVTNEDMFYGRGNYIESAYKTMVEDGVSYVIYGQFRSGKSSVLTHLEKRLEDNPQIVVAKLGDVGAFMGGESQTPMFYRFLHRILLALRDGVRKMERNRALTPISFSVPDSKTFYEHPSPEDYFYELMDGLQSQKMDLADWKMVRIIVSMDEFSYIYGQIVQGKLSEDFMKSWKALLAKDYFNVVLVAQDVFPKFFAQYENAFGTIFPKRITYLDDESAKLLINEPIKRLNKGESKFREDAIEKIIELTAGHPWYIQIFCNTLVNYINSDKQPYITGANIEKVKEGLLRGTDRKDNFKNFIENGDPSIDRISDRDIIKVLKKIAEHTKHDEYCTVNLLSNCDTQATLNEVLKDLESREVIATHGEKGFKIRVGLFKEWLNENPNVWE
jgi:tetratricopeptide (TPR) repeat protein